MNRPPLEVADLVRAADAPSSNAAAGGSPGNTSPCCGPSHAVAPPPWVGISMSAPTVATVRPSSTTAAATGTARSVKPTPVLVGSKRASSGASPHALCPCCLYPTLMNWRRSPCRTRNSCTISCCRPVPQLSSKSLAIPDISARRSASSVCSTPGIKNSNITRTHCVVPAGGLSLARTHWIPSRSRFFLPVKVLSRVFRGKFVAALQRNFRQGKLGFHGNLRPLAHPKIFSGWIRTLFRNDWHVYSKRPFGGAEHALCYLGHYTHRVAISNHRLVSFVDDQVTFRWRDSTHNNEHKLMTLALDEFLRRFLLHLLPKGFVRIRHFGFLANRRRATLLPLCFQLLGAIPQVEQQASAAKEPRPLWRCPKCGGPMVVLERLTAAQLQLRSPPWLAGVAA